MQTEGNIDPRPRETALQRPCDLAGQAGQRFIHGRD
jgi:hypothetical protein